MSATSTITPELLSPAEAAHMCGIGERTWWRKHAAKEVPAPVIFGRRQVWRRGELLRWIDAKLPDGTLPDRETWEKMQHLTTVGRRSGR